MQAAQKLAAAHQMLLEALPSIPLGTSLHEQVSKIATDLGKHLTKAGEEVRMTMQTLMQTMRAQPQRAQMAALGPMMGAPGPNAPPATMPPGPGGAGSPPGMPG